MEESMALNGRDMPFRHLCKKPKTINFLHSRKPKTINFLQFVVKTNIELCLSISVFPLLKLEPLLNSGYVCVLKITAPYP